MSQLFGMDNILSTLSGKYDNTVNKENKIEKNEKSKNNFDSSKLSETASNYLKELKTKYSDSEIVVVGSDQADQATEIASNVKTNKSTVIVLTEDELEKMATDEETRTQNEALLDEAFQQLPEAMKKMSESGLDIKTMGIEIKNGTTNYFAVVDKSLSAQKERIEAKQEEKRAEQKEAKKENLTKVTASSLDEFIKKLEDVLYETKADSVVTEQEKMVGQSFDFTI